MKGFPFGKTQIVLRYGETAQNGKEQESQFHPRFFPGSGGVLVGRTCPAELRSPLCRGYQSIYSRMEANEQEIQGMRRNLGAPRLPTRVKIVLGVVGLCLPLLVIFSIIWTIIGRFLSLRRAVLR